MQLIENYHKLKKAKVPIFQTRDVAGILDMNIAHASQVLRRLAKAELLVPLCKGLWAFSKGVDILNLPRYLTAPFPSYISLQTALFKYDMISQIPSVVYAVTLARSKQMKTPLAEVSLHHLDPSFFFGFTVDPQTEVAIATPEKALLDFFYLSSGKSKLFTALPEVELPKDFKLKEVYHMIDKIPSFQRRTQVLTRFEAWMNRSNLT